MAPRDRPAVRGTVMTDVPASRTLEHLIARAIYDDLVRQARARGYVLGPPAPHQKTSLDGEFSLMSAARRVLRNLEFPGALPARTDPKSHS